jgi:hypothetical protein
MMRKYFKTQKDYDRLLHMHPVALMILFAVINYITEAGYTCLITATVSTQEEDFKLQRVSLTHQTGRAFDVSVNGMPDIFIKNLIWDFKSRYESLYGARDSKGLPRLIVDHVGTARHLHFQIHSKYTIDLRGKL